MAKNMQIKSHGWHKVTLTNDLLTGDTFACRDLIKKYLGGKWDAVNKGWRVDLALVEKHSNGGENILVK